MQTINKAIEKGSWCMRKARYTDDITKLATIDQAKERYKLSRGKLVNLASQENALRRFGRSVRIDIVKMDKAIENY